jgi:membrane-associated phospholipid phosphatase
MLEYGEKLWGPAWTRIFGTLGSNPWAAMPSLHFATATMAAILLSDAGGKVEGTLGWAYALSLGFALIYLGEHYVTDLLAGAGVVLLARKGEPLARPIVEMINRRLQRLEAIAAGG